MQDKVGILEKVPLFHGVEQECLKKLADKALEVKYIKGETIIEDGSAGDSLFILTKGEVCIIKKLTLLSDVSGGDKEKALIRMKGEHLPFFGEMAFIGEEKKRSAKVLAETDCFLLEIKAADIAENMDEKPELCSVFYKNLSRVLAKRLQKANEDILKLSTALSLALDEY